jgi:hypothetical protein
MGNLPRSRPGHRSEKRTKKTAARAAPSRAARPKSSPPPKPKTSAPPKPERAAPPQPVSGGGDPVGDAIRTVTGVAATGARVAGGVAREVLRRLPRP